ncbi:MAG: hypothetical protein VR65_08015 [Desulfobulbaceae bacterium BRH_c16a]|nr:MAG: hypothetical protein VR65_08015 [Desulfobulbaceae bacterium BRH_c16a]
MKKEVKQLVWQLLVSGVRLLPGALVKQLCALAFDSRQSKSNAKEHLRTLLDIQFRLRWYIDQQAIICDGGVHPKHRLTDYHRFFVERISSGDTVLDIGCGCGALALSMARCGARVTGIDIDSSHIAKARSEFSCENVLYMVGDVTSNLPSGDFSVIVMSNVLEHLEKRALLLRSLVNKYSPRAILIRVPMSNRHWEVPLRQELGLPHFSDPTHCVEYTFESFMEEMKLAQLLPVFSDIIWGEIWAEVRSNNASGESIQLTGNKQNE